MAGFLLAFFVVVAAALGCFLALPEARRRAVSRGRLALVPLLALVPTGVLLYLPPPEFGDPQVLMLALVAAVVGVARGALVGLRVDHAQGVVLLSRAPEAFWIMFGVLLLMLLDVVGEPVGRLGSPFIGMIEMVMVLLSFSLLGRNAAVLVRSRDAPQYDL